MVGASAAALIIASAGFGAFYAWTTGSQHGPLIGALSVIMALGLEGAKPFAIEGALTAARSWARRTELHTIISSAERDIASMPLATDADPAATALAVYLAAIGVPSDAGTLSKWLALVPVLALEVGSALAVVLAGLGGLGTAPREMERRVSVEAPLRGPMQPTLAREHLSPPRTRAPRIAPFLAP